MEDENNQEIIEGQGITQEINNQEISVRLEIPDLRNLIGWATFNAIINIVFGALSCIGIITAAYGVPQIIAGVKLLNVTEELRSYLDTNDISNIPQAFQKLQKYFKINGIAIIIKIVLSVLILILYFVLVVVYIRKMPGMMRNNGF